MRHVRKYEPTIGSVVLDHQGIAWQRLFTGWSSADGRQGVWGDIEAPVSVHTPGSSNYGEGSVKIVMTGNLPPTSAGL